MKKIFLVTSILMLAVCFSSVSFAVRNINQYVTNVVFKIDEPLYGRTLDFTAEAEGGVVVKDVIWQEKEAINDASETTTVTAGTWQLRIIFGLATGKTGISTNNIISINDKTGLGWKKDDNGDYYVDTSYVVSVARPSNSSTGSRPTTSNSIPTRPSVSTTKELSKIEFTIPELKNGGEQIKGEDITITEGAGISNMSWTNVTGKTFMSAKETYRDKNVYSIRVYFWALEGYKIADNVEVTVNGDKIEITALEDGSGKYLFDKEFTCGASTSTTEPEIKETISKVEVKIPDVVVGNKQIVEKDIELSKGAKISGMSWSNDTTFLFMTDDEKYEENNKYTLKLFLEADTGYEFSKDLKVLVNGKEANITPNEDQYIYTNQYDLTVKPEETKPSGEEKEVEIPVLKTIDVTVKEPEVGKALPTTYEVKSNLVDKATEYKVGEEKEDNLAKWTPEDKEVKPGTKYTFKLEIALKNSMAEISKELKITVNKKEVKPTVKDGIYTVKYDFETEKPIEEKLYNHFEFEIAAPKIGEKPATTAKALSEKYKVTKVEWLTKDEKFVEGETYKVQIRFELIDKNVRSDYFATINGEMADLPNGDENYQKNTMYAEFTFPTLRDESKKVSWSNASAWALDELSKASNKGLIPQVLDKGDLKQNVTRKEFAHIAVLLYEKLSGQGIFVTHAPFKDTDDVEIAKAYTVGITNGVSETEFAPDTEITREQMATMMARALEKARVDTFVDLEKITKFVDDDKMHDWSRSAIYFMSSVEIIKGMGENRFGVKENASREQSIIIAVRSVEKFAK